MQKINFSQSVGLARVNKDFISNIITFCSFNDNQVPVVVVFTKMDALDSENWKGLMKESLPLQQIKQQVQQKSLSKAVGYFEKLCDLVYPPKGSVYLQGTTLCHFQLCLDAD